MNISPDDAADDMEDINHRAESINLDEASRYAVEAVQTNIDNAADRYQPRVPSIYDDGHPLLIKSGDMRSGVRGDIRGNEVEISNDMEYGEYIHSGTHKMVARPFMDLDDQDLDRIEEILADQMGLNE